MNLDTIKDPRLRKRIEDTMAAANQLRKDVALACPASVRPKKRIRQSSKPLMNALETEWFEKLKAEHPWIIRPQTLRFRLGNGIWYKPDMTCIPSSEQIPIAWEVKGPHSFRGGLENLKIAAGLYPEWIWILAWKDKDTGDWITQHVLP